ncbi:MAG: heme exporter protein CcmD [Pseudomonadota bacterium]
MTAMDYIGLGYAASLFVLGTLLLISWRQKSKAAQELIQLEKEHPSSKT